MAYTTIKKPSDYFNTNLWTGNGTTATGITGVGFQPDMTWIKERSQIRSHVLFDVIRGATVQLNPNDTASDATVAESLQSFDSDGFTVGNATSVNQNGETYVGWNWLASNTTASNTDGSITSTVSANTTSGFSIVSYTGTGANATVGHGLGIAPKFLIVKNRSSVTSWGVQTSTGAGFEMNLNNNEAQTATSVYWNSTDPTSSVFSVGTNAATNNSGDNMIAYCFAEVKGFSKFSSYTGNGNADGTFVYTGFKPAMIIVKRTNLSANWDIWDNARDPVNGMEGVIYPNDTTAEGRGTVYLDFLSNGFKWRDGNSKWNASGDSYIYMAFAEEPLVGDNPATAR
jgi:hypothetical protein